MKPAAKLPILQISILALSGLCMAFFSSCRETEEPAPEAEVTPPTEAPAEKLVLFNWTDYMSQDAIELFTEKTGIEVEYRNFEATEELRAMLESAPGEFDVIIADEMTIAELADLRLIQELERDQIPLISNLDPRYLNMDVDPGNKYSLPYLWGSTLIAYRADEIDLKEKSWNLFWDPAVAGRAAMLDEMEEVFAIGLARNGFSINSTDPEELRIATDTLSEAVSSNKIEFGGIYEGLDRLLTSEIVALHCYAGDAAAWAEKDENIDYFVPKEGARLFIDSFAIARDTTRSELAHKFINFMLEAEPSAMNSNYLWSATPNTAAIPLLDEELLADDVVFPAKEVLDRCEFLKATTAEREKALQIGMRRLQREAREAAQVAQQEVEAESQTAEAAVSD